MSDYNKLNKGNKMKGVVSTNANIILMPDWIKIGLVNFNCEVKSVEFIVN